MRVAMRRISLRLERLCNYRSTARVNDISIDDTRIIYRYLPAAPFFLNEAGIASRGLVSRPQEI
jgi:hypothetical protein